jgi:2,3-bisphosphoglycerate-independent phosphoglycerate mutase
MKALLILSDGIADVPCPQLGGRTPLEAGTNPHLDRLAAEGITGLMDPLKPGIPAGSDTAHIAIFGENPFSVYRGRGYLEALGVGLSPGADDIGFRVNFGTVTDGVINRRRAGRDPTAFRSLSATSHVRSALRCPSPSRRRRARVPLSS